MITTKKIAELVQKAEVYDEIYEYFVRMVNYRDGLMFHDTVGYADKVSLITKKKYKRDKGQLRYYNEERIIVESFKIDGHKHIAIQDEIKRLNVIIDTLSIFIQINQNTNEDRNRNKNQNRELEKSDDSTQRRTSKRDSKVKRKF